MFPNDPHVNVAYSAPAVQVSDLVHRSCPFKHLFVLVHYSIIRVQEWMLPVQVQKFEALHVAKAVRPGQHLQQQSRRAWPGRT